MNSSKMLWELKAPLNIALAKENIGQGNLFKYMRPYNMFISRFSFRYNFIDYTERIENKLFWKGVVVLCLDRLTKELMVLEIEKTKTNANGLIIELDAIGENNYKRKGLIPGKDCVILYSDNTKIAPILYIWSIYEEVLVREDILVQQDNMLRKPILVSGMGTEFDEASVKLQNILSGVQFINVKSKNNKTNLMSDSKFAEVLNLQVNNAYKGKELWESRGHYEELIKDYLGYPTVANQKKERMIQAEVSQNQAIAKTFYDVNLNNRTKAVEECKRVLGIDIEFKPILIWEDKENDNKDNVG